MASRTSCSRFVGAVFLSFAGVALVAVVQAARPATPDVKSVEAAKLVQSALKAGLAGDASGRATLLSEAITADPDCAAARWQSGQVKFQGEWRTPAEVAELVSSDKRWQEYGELRDASSGTLQDHIALAQWCLRNGLATEERYHWCNVIVAAPGHKQARQRLGVREFRGGLFTEEQIAQHQRQLKEAEANLRKYKPRFIELCRDARSESGAVREAALAKIRVVSDPGAIEALRTAIARDRRKEADPQTRDLNLALVAALSNMKEHNATLYLVNYALFSESKEVRKLAAESLRPRATTDYVPLLMAALTAPIEAEFDVVAAPDGTVRMLQTLRQSGPEADAEHVQSLDFEVEGVIGGDRASVDPNAVLGRHLGHARDQAATTKAQVDSYNDAIAKRNARIQETLKIATGMDLGSNPEDYWTAWSAENEMHYAEAKPVRETYDESTHTYCYEQAPVYYPSADSDYREPKNKPAPTGGSSYYSPYRGPISPRPAPTPRGNHSCFAPGTLVWTQAGPAPIEQIVVGDMVLAQHPTTGELDYRPVLQTTFGAPAPVVRLSLPGESITATLGHRFWLNGRGWQMAKELKPAMSLHSLDLAIDVGAIEKAEDLSCHNLVVNEFHTFFVGKSRLLVHDKSCPAPAPVTMPGMRGQQTDAALSSLARD